MIAPTFADVLDLAYRWLWRLPECTPGDCFCRRTCLHMIREPGACGYCGDLEDETAMCPGCSAALLDGAK